MKRIICGNAADPSIVCANGKYYIVISTGKLFPGLFVYESSDLNNWKKISSACLGGKIKDIWAPHIAFENDTFYIFFTADLKNYVTHARSANGPWSTPVDLGLDGYIDPGFIKDNDGTPYLFLNNGMAAKLSPDLLSVCEEPFKAYPIWDMPKDWKTEGTCAEGPKPFYFNGYYYILTAQGGTAGPPTSHMAILMRSKSLTDGWELAPTTPLIKTYSKSEPYWCVGHASAFEDYTGEWHLVFHGYRNGHMNEGRHILLCDAKWSNDGWLMVDKDALKLVESPSLPTPFYTDFSNGLEQEVAFFKGFSNKNIKLDKGGLTLKGAGTALKNGRPLLHLCTSGDYIIETELTADCEAGLTLFYSEKCSLGVCIKDGYIYEICNGAYHPICPTERSACLRLEKLDDVVTAYYKTGGEWVQCPVSFDASGFHHNVFGGFSALYPGIYAAGKGQAYFKHLSFTPIGN